MHSIWFSCSAEDIKKVINSRSVITTVSQCIEHLIEINQCKEINSCQ